MPSLIQDRPVFILGVDTEAYWVPLIDNHDMVSLGMNDEKCRVAIQTLLGIVEKHKISATWAVVGYPIIKGCDPFKCTHWRKNESQNCDQTIDSNPCYGSSESIETHGKQIFKLLLQSKVRQEIGYHSFSHSNFTKITREQAQLELRKVKSIEKEWEIRIRSFVFPGNHIGHTSLLAPNGFNIYRGCVAGKYSPNRGQLRRLMTGVYDKLVCQTVAPEWKESIWEICGSMGFSDVQLPQRTVPVIKRCVSKAIKTKKTVHIYLHPWDLLVQPRLIDDLDRLLDYVERRAERGDIDVMNMGQYADYLNTLGDR